jgi:hypothetical protein
MLIIQARVPYINCDRGVLCELVIVKPPHLKNNLKIFMISFINSIDPWGLKIVNRLIVKNAPPFV